MRIVTYLFMALLCSVVTPVTAQQKQPIKAPEKLPSGTYYIIHTASSEALTPVGASAGQNVFVQEFNNDRLQVSGNCASAVEQRTLNGYGNSNL